MKVLGYITVALLISLLAYVLTDMAHSGMQFVRGKYGEICYPTGQEHKNIKYRVYFPSLESCKQSLGE